jgi:hypothetical protein
LGLSEVAGLQILAELLELALNLLKSVLSCLREIGLEQVAG